jgi:hypothetical protein
MIIKYLTKNSARGRKINKMVHLEETSAGKAPRCNNAGNRTVAAYRRAQAMKGRAKQKPDTADLRKIRKYKKQRRCIFRRYLSSVW